MEKPALGSGLKIIILRVFFLVVIVIIVVFILDIIIVIAIFILIEA